MLGAANYLGPNLVSWRSRKQTVVSRSSTEAEYRNLAAPTADILWIQTLLKELKVPHYTPIIGSHMELDVLFVRKKG